MRASLLARERITILRDERNQSKSGAIKIERKEIQTVRCYVISQSGTEKKDGKELFNSFEAKFRIRWNDNVKPTDFISYNNQEFKITFIKDNVYDRTKEITAELINK